MAEYLTPGVYVEEKGEPPGPIQGVSTTVAGFVGPTLQGPDNDALRPVTSFTEFERIYGGLEPVAGKPSPTINYIAFAARAFFNNGGRRLYISRTPVDADEADYAGTRDGTSGLRALEAIDDIAIVAMPGATAGHSLKRSAAISQCLIDHCERIKYRFALIDPPEDQTVEAIVDYRAMLDSSRAALYYPWVQSRDPLDGEIIPLPPSGFIAGLYVKNDIDRGVHKAPASLPIRQVDGLQYPMTPEQNDTVNAVAINVLRFFGESGYRVWGARTLSTDPEWQYINVRRYFSYLEKSIDRGTQWAVFEPNGPALWDTVRQNIEVFLTNEWRAGRLAGAVAEDAFYVRCDRSTMTQSDIDIGRVVCLVGVALVKPAEFVIFRKQWDLNFQNLAND